MNIARDQDGKLTDISQTIFDQKCFCANCGIEFILKNKKPQPRKREIHFAHKNHQQCKGGLESYLHKVAKQIISEHAIIMLPGIGAFSYDQVDIESSLTDQRPDALITNTATGQKIALEVFVTNRKTANDIKKYLKKNLECYEIDLSNFDINVGLQAIRYQVIEDLLCKTKLLAEGDKLPTDGAANSSTNRFNPLPLIGTVIFLCLLPTIIRALNRLFTSRRRR